jgi:putative FmdB family regulatory protein
MPLYDFECRQCYASFDAFLPMEARDTPEPCPKCGEVATRVLSPARVAADYPGYQCPITNKWIEGRRAHAENLARHDCRVQETGEREAWMRQRDAMNEQLETKMADTFTAEFERLPSSEREAVGAYMETHGATTVRQTPGAQ